MCVSNNSEYNQMVIENVLQGDDFVMEVQCPECGKPASSKQYDRNDGGCINAYSRTDCSHCGYHDCDDDNCGTCEASMEQSYAYNEAYGQYDLMLEFNFEDADPSKPVSPVEITYAKLYFVNKVKAVCGSDCDHLFNKYVQSYLMNRESWRESEMKNNVM
ncbi:hypothetical protein OPW39_15705 [Vibrio europaeus]|uniref:hypothetical protein n=1 Tax=Vibrio europaeus TaxID=300876 RepID=UPI00233F1DD8|nr:hypothetical protein [Vibrio europaeus]MDC5870253.1 hypothetical protein [Vibrio europaeus]